MYFEYDPRKSTANEKKHGIGFEEAQQIWNDKGLIVLHAKKKDEKRFMAIGRNYHLLISVIYTIRNHSIRIISARKATRNEVKLYEQHNYER